MALNTSFATALNEQMRQNLEKRYAMTPEQRQASDRANFQKGQAVQQQQMEAMDPNKMKGVDPFLREQMANGAANRTNEDHWRVMANQDKLLADAYKRSKKLDASRRAINNEMQDGSASIKFADPGTASRPLVPGATPVTTSTEPRLPAPPRMPSRKAPIALA